MAGLGLVGAPMKKRYHQDEAVSVSVDEESVSPRVLFPVGGSIGGTVARRLEFYSSGEWSPIPPAVASAASVASVASWEAATPIEILPREDGIGECNVCYASLPARSNHIFTLCGHLFCVKCLLTWWDTSSTCPMCRAEILEEEEVVPAPVIVDVLLSDSDSDSDGESDSNGAIDHDDFVGGGGVNHLPAQQIPIIDRYLYADDGIHWSSPITNPFRDDDEVQLTLDEAWNIRLNREIASTLWVRLRFRETLFTDVDVLGGTFHTFIARRNWIGLGPLDINHLMYEFVMARTCAYNAPVETNFFGHITSIVVVEIDHPNPEDAHPANVVGEEENSWWENNHEYAFVVRVFSPSAPYGMYNVDEGTFEPAELLFRFSDIRRMYLIQTMERGAV